MVIGNFLKNAMDYWHRNINVITLHVGIIMDLLFQLAFNACLSFFLNDLVSNCAMSNTQDFRKFQCSTLVFSAIVFSILSS